MKKIIIILGMIFGVVPFNLLVDDKYKIDSMGISYFIAIIIILLFIGYKGYEKRQKKELRISLILCIIHLSCFVWSIILDMNLFNWKENEMSDMGAYLLAALVLYTTYFAYRIMCLIFGIDVLVGLFKKSKKQGSHIQ